MTTDTVDSLGWNLDALLAAGTQQSGSCMHFRCWSFGRLLYLNSELKRVPLPGLRVGWNHIQVTAHEHQCSCSTLRAVLQDEVASPLHKGYMLHFDRPTIVLGVRLQDVQQMLDGSERD